MILAGDVGGTKTKLGLFRISDGHPESVREETFPSREFPSFEAMVSEFLSDSRRRVEAAAVGVAGPVVAGRSQVVNVRWPIAASSLARELGLDRAEVINDLEANAWGISELPARKLQSLTPGLRAGDGNRALIAPGTGLGMAILFRQEDVYRPSASEGGHQEFAPRDDREIELLRFLRRRHGRVSIERAVAGPGFAAIYQFLLEQGLGKESAMMSARLAKAGDPNAVISAAGVADEDPVARMTLEMFVSLLGSAAGDLALVAKATGGIFVGGGIPPKILPALRSGDFLRSFRNKGRLTPLLEKIPVKVILEPRTALIGAAVCALHSMAQRSPKARRRSRKRGR